MKKKFYITTPIYYINAEPSVGSACTTVAADVVARLHRQLGEEVFYLTGTDEHGEKVDESAQKAGLSVQEYCDQIAPKFSEAWKLLNISNDFFIRTTDKRHEKVVGEVLTKMYESGDVYKDKYEGYYCIGCESFKTEKELEDNHCPMHPPEKTVWKSEENWFFKLSKYVPKIIELIENDETNYVFPEGKRKEILAKLKAGVRDISISRESVSWGIPIPWDTKHTIYVWIDALINYYSATQFLEGKADFWPANLHVLGKEILWFHAVIWQAMLMSAKIEIPISTYTHGFYTIDGQKMSKSLGNTIPPKEMVAEFGVDASRYLIAKSFPNENDVDIGLGRFRETYNADLANNLGNLVSRVSKLAQGMKVEKKTLAFEHEFIDLIERLKLGEAIEFVLNKWINVSNAKINEVAPWKLDKEDPKRVELMNFCVDNLAKAAWHLKAFMPEASEKIEKVLDGEVGQMEGYLFPRILTAEQASKTGQVEQKNASEKLIIGVIKNISKHPDANTLQVVDVDTGTLGVVQIVTGARNIKEGDVVPLVLPGGRVNSPKGGIVKIEKGKLRGVKSFGMLASELELGVGEDHTGIYILDKKLADKVGQAIGKFVEIKI